jgi:hypothetical protein
MRWGGQSHQMLGTLYVIIAFLTPSLTLRLRNFLQGVRPVQEILHEALHSGTFGDQAASAQDRWVKLLQEAELDQALRHPWINATNVHDDVRSMRIMLVRVPSLSLP